MEEHDFELSVGDSVQVEGYTVTVIDIDGDEVSFKVDCDEPPDFPRGRGFDGAPPR